MKQVTSEKKYVRDRRSPKPKDETTSLKMSKIRSKNTGPELRVRQFIYSAGFRGYRLNYRKVLGRPDICFTKWKVAIFINGCFWHRCPNCKLPLPKHNQAFWTKKFNANVMRDEEKSRILAGEGWKVIVLWECTLVKHNDWESSLMEQINHIHQK